MRERASSKRTASGLRWSAPRGPVGGDGPVMKHKVKRIHFVEGYLAAAPERCAWAASRQCRQGIE
jgi:hypothetical protein